MTTKYRINWRTGKGSEGQELLTFDVRKEAQDRADGLNIQLGGPIAYGTVHHWVEPVEVEEEQCSPNPEP